MSIKFILIGLSVCVQTFTSTGTNLSLQFCSRGLSDDKPPDSRPTSESVNFDREPNRVHLCSNFIMNGVCVRWVGWIDLEQLTGKARLIYDEDQAKVPIYVYGITVLDGHLSIITTFMGPESDHYRQVSLLYEHD